MSMTREIAGLASTFGLGLLLSGCATQPAYPLMTPIGVAQTFGYYDRPADSGHWLVSYVTPPAQALGYRFDTSPTADRAKAMAYDLASAHAAQLAQQSGWQGFDVLDKHTSSDDEFIGPSWDWGPYPYGWGGWGWHRWGGWGWGGGPWGDDWYYPPEQRVQAEATLTIAFTNDVKPGQFRAADVLQETAARYPGAFGPPAASPAAPPPPAPPSPGKPSA